MPRRPRQPRPPRPDSDTYESMERLVGLSTASTRALIDLRDGRDGTAPRDLAWSYSKSVQLLAKNWLETCRVLGDMKASSTATSEPISEDDYDGMWVRDLDLLKETMGELDSVSSAEASNWANAFVGGGLSGSGIEAYADSRKHAVAMAILAAGMSLSRQPLSVDSDDESNEVGI